MTKRKVCVVSVSRADYGYLLAPLRELRAAKDFDLQFVATGSLLCGVNNNALHIMRGDGFAPDMTVDCILSSDTSVATGKSVALCLAGMCDVFSYLRPELVMIVGDRFEILAVAQAAYILGIPIAHLGGGDVTAGAFDEGFRHAITKLSHIHFPTNALSAERIVKMGENRAMVHAIGSTSLDLASETIPASRDELSAKFGYRWMHKNLLVTFHPATIDSLSPLEQAKAFVGGLTLLSDDIGIFITGTNIDPGGQEILQVLLEFVEHNEHRCTYCSHLGQYFYYSALSLMDAVVGNSSSGLYEAPSFKTPTVNIGPRQDGRCRAASVLDCPNEPGAIANSILQAFQIDCTGVKNPYGDGHATKKLMRVLRENKNWTSLLKKTFFEY